MLRRRRLIYLGQCMLVISLSSTVYAETALKGIWLNENKKLETPVNLSDESSPKGLYDVYGIRNEPTGAFAERASFRNQLAIFQDDLIHDTRTPNRTLYQSPKGPELPNCYVVPQFGGGTFVTVASLTFTPGSPPPGEEGVVEIHYSAQINTPRGTTADGVFLECTVSNANGSAPCSNTENFPVLLRQWQDNSANGNLSMPAYHGHVVLEEEDADLATTLTIRLTSLNGKQPTACSNNVIVRYFDPVIQ